MASFWKADEIAECDGCGEVKPVMDCTGGILCEACFEESEAWDIAANDG